MKIPGPQTGYTDLLDYATVKKLEAQAEDPRYFPLRPSASGFCSRRLTYDLMEYEGHAKYEKETIKPNVSRIFSLGHSIEYHLIREMTQIPGVKLRYKQQAVTLFELDPTSKKDKNPRMIEGSVDLAVWSDEWKCVIDIKSSKDNFSKAFGTKWDETLSKFNHMDSLVKIDPEGTAWYIEDLPEFLEEVNDPFLANNFWQLNAYCCSEFFQERGVDHGAIIKYNKNDSRLYELRFKPSMEMLEQLKDKFNTINKAVAKKKPELVKKDFVLGSSSCSFCPYAKNCWGEDTKKAFFKTLPPKKWPKDTGKIPEGPVLEDLFAKFEKVEKDVAKRKTLEETVVEQMLEAKVNKIRLANGNIYELKHLKSPRPHFEVRRGKL